MIPYKSETDSPAPLLRQILTKNKLILKYRKDQSSANLTWTVKLTLMNWCKKAVWFTQTAVPTITNYLICFGYQALTLYLVSTHLSTKPVHIPSSKTLYILSNANIHLHRSEIAQKTIRRPPVIFFDSGLGMWSLYKGRPMWTKFSVLKSQCSLFNMYKHSIFNYLSQTKKRIFIIRFG